MDFVHLHTHSHYSPDGVSGVEGLVRRAQELGMSALALTDHNTMAGVPAFCKACRDAGIRPIIGAELNIAPSERTSGSAEMFKIGVLVENEPGYRNLIALVNKAHLRPRRGVPCIVVDDLRDTNTGIIALTGGPESELYWLLANGKLEETEAHVVRMVKMLGRENLVFEIQDFGVTRQRQLNDRIYKLAEFLSLRCVATNNVHYLRPEDFVCHAFLLQGPPPGFFTNQNPADPAVTRHLATGEQMKAKFEPYPKALYGTAELADRCVFMPNFDKKRFPIHDFVRGFDADSFLWDLAFREARNRFTELSAEMKDRLNLEFDYIRTQRMSNNMLLLWNVAQFCRKNRVCMGVGRGNMISSLVSYILGITQINPLEYKLRFLGLGSEETRERRLNVEIPTKHCGALEEFLRETFGADSCCAVGEYEWQERQPLARDICSWLDIPPTRTNEIVASIEKNPFSADEPARLFTAIAEKKAAPGLELVRYMASRLLPRPRGLKAAENQIAISAENLNHLAPRVLADEKIVTQMDPAALDLLNIPRIYIESNPMLDVLDAAAAWVRREDFAAFDPDRIHLDDSDTFDVLDRGLTNGIDPFHSITLKSLLRAHRPRNFMSLVKIKSMERGSGPRDQEPDIREHVPECLMTYRLAFIKVHYPVSFMTALLTCSYSNRRKFAVILREAKMSGLRILQPDINHSSYEFSRAHKNIRTGLMVVSGMTPKAYAEISRVRKGGDFHNLLDLCRRTDVRLTPNSLISNLIKTGACDSLGLKRAQMLAIMDEEGDAIRRTLSGSDGLEPPKMEELPQQEIIRHEIAAAGYCISVDQLLLYKDLIRQCRALTPYDIASKHVDKEVHVAGFLDHVEHESPLIEDGEQVLLDMEGRVVAMPKKASRLYEQAINAHAPVMIGGIVHRRKDEIYVKALTVFTLKMVQQMSENVLQVELDMTGEDARTLKLIRNVVGYYKGRTTKLVLTNVSGAMSRWHLGKIAKTPVFFSPPFYFALRKILPEDRIGIVATETMDRNLLHTLSPQRFPKVEERARSPLDMEENAAVVDTY